MKWKKQLPALFLAAVWMVSLLAGCSQEQAAGISLSVCVGSEPVTLDPIYAEESGDQTILVHLYENLMRVALDATCLLYTSGRCGHCVQLRCPR